MEKGACCSSNSKETGDGSGTSNHVKGGGFQLQTDHILKPTETCEELSKETKDVDRISKLNDDLLVDIISLLPRIEVIKTSVLSKRWKDLWKCIHSIVHQLEIFDKVNKIVNIKKRSNINKFCIHFRSGNINFYHSDIHTWICLTSEENVQNLLLEFEDPDLEHIYELPQDILEDSGSLLGFELPHCLVSPRAMARWDWLRNLSLYNVPLSDNELTNIVSGCPFLETMKLSHFSSFRFLDIRFSRLHTLKLDTSAIFFHNKYPYYQCMEILAPNVKSLEISGELGDTICSLYHFFSLEEAELSFHMSSVCYYENYEEECGNMLSKHVSRLQNVGHIKIGGWCIWILSVLELKRSTPQPLYCKSLILHTKIGRWDLPGIGRLLRSSFRLESLVIEMDVYEDFNTKFPRLKNFDAENYFKSIESFELQKLRDVEIIDFGNRFCALEQASNYERTFQLELIQFLLKNAVKLEKLDIKLPQRRCSDCSTYCVPLLFTTLLSFPRSCKLLLFT